jgi:predicted alpha-1,6-mannanase (GH76 family)
LWSLCFTTVWVTVLLPFVVTAKIGGSVSANEQLNRALLTASRIVTCEYQDMSGMFKNEPSWQSGSTLETLADFVALSNSPLKSLLHQTFMNTDIFTGGPCYDGYQWWLLTWLQAYTVDPDINYLYRAADIYDYVAVNAWNASACRGGLQLCSNNSYKSAIANELFLLSSIRLHPYAALLDRPPTFYLNWTLTAWNWFATSGLINGDFLVNDGLSDGTCLNNNGTTWTYNQGVVLSALGLLYNATQNATLLDTAQRIADATIQKLVYSDGILKEPCEPNCTMDQALYKGIFVRHLAYLIPYLTDAAHIQKYSSFLQQNAEMVWTSQLCDLDGLYGYIWSNQSSSSCEASRNTSATSAAWDLFVSAAKSNPSNTSAPSNWTFLGLGNCADDKNASMPNYNQINITESVCRATAEQDSGAVAYDHQLGCNSVNYCRIRTLSDPHQVPKGWNYENATAKTVTRSNNYPVTGCYLKVH